jgi:hypothetical protein
MSGLTCFYQGKERTREAMNEIKPQTLSRQLRKSNVLMSETWSSRVLEHSTVGFEVRKNRYSSFKNVEVVLGWTWGTKNETGIDFDAEFSKLKNFLASQNLSLIEIENGTIQHEDWNTVRDQLFTKYNLK